MSPIHRRAPSPVYKISVYHQPQDKEAPPTSARCPTSSISRKDELQDPLSLFLNIKHHTTL
jgi:hypothetical protein